MAKHNFENIDTFCDFLEGRDDAHIAAINEFVVVAEDLMFEHAVNLHGKNPPLRDLLPSTQKDRVRRGYLPNDPLLRNGLLLRDNVEHMHTKAHSMGGNHEASADVGSPEKIAAYHEHGFRARNGKFVKPRPVFLLTAKATQKPLAELISAEIKRVFAA